MTLFQPRLGTFDPFARAALRVVATRLESHRARAQGFEGQPPQWPRQRWMSGQRTPWILRSARMSTVSLLL